MSIPLSVLIVEDSASDAGLMVRHLQKAGFDVLHARVETAQQMRDALRTQAWELVLCDFSLPGFGARVALTTLQDTGLDIPFIVVSGAIGDETAIELMRLGARDYLMKNNMARLAPAVERELREACQRRAAEQRADFLLHHDALTGLPNRVLLRDRLQLAIDAAKGEARQVALLLLNIDRLQRVNEHFGHDAGDALLKELSSRLLALLVPGDTLARLGSDEFVMTVAQFADTDAIMVVAQRLMQHIAQPFRILDEEVSVTASIGISVYPGDGIGPDDLLKGADTVLSLIKSEGRNGVRFLTAQMNIHALRRIALENQLRHAVERDELLLHYQPQVALDDGRICGVEALIRWRNRELGLISPSDFIPLAEDAGLILAIGEWVMFSACAQNKAWQDAGLPPMRIAVNVSAHQFTSGALTAMVRKALQETGLEPQYLEVELTESVLMRDMELSMQQIAGLRQMGVSVSLDDFGTGYSSLAYLSHFTIDKLKIDQGFIRNITTAPRSAAIANISIALARSLGITAIAEGVETESQRDYLRKAGCDEAQGYFFSRPLPPDQLALLVRDWEAENYGVDIR